MIFGARMAVFAAALLSASVGGAAVVFSSVPNLLMSDGPTLCSDCYGGTVFELLDQFTLASPAAINGLNLVVYTPYGSTNPFTVEIYDQTHTSIIFSQLATPTLVQDAGNDSSLVTAQLTGLDLTAGNFWIGVIAPMLALPTFSTGGNDSLFTATPDTGLSLFSNGGNAGYQLLSPVPEPASWSLMIAGFALAGGTLRRRVAQAA